MTKPYSVRVFGLPSTHRITHARSNDVQHLRFLMHCFGFFVGMRMDDTRAGFLDAVPLEPGKLNDFVIRGDGLARALEVADAFWARNAGQPEVATTLLGVMHSLWLSKRPNQLAFEEFIFAYTAIEGAYAVGRATRGVATGSHGQRIRNLCVALEIPVPLWATDQMTVNVVGVRNDALHEGLFLSQPMATIHFTM